MHTYAHTQADTRMYTQFRHTQASNITLVVIFIFPCAVTLSFSPEMIETKCVIHHFRRQDLLSTKPTEQTVVKSKIYLNTSINHFEVK